MYYNLKAYGGKNVCRQARTPLLQFSDDLPEPTKTCCNIPSNLQKAHIQGLNQTVQSWSSPLFPFICFHRNLKSLCYGLYCDRRSATEWWRGNYDWQTLSFQNPYILTRRESCSIRSGGNDFAPERIHRMKPSLCRQASGSESSHIPQKKTRSPRLTLGSETQRQPHNRPFKTFKLLRRWSAGHYNTVKIPKCKMQDFFW